RRGRPAQARHSRAGAEHNRVGDNIAPQRGQPNRSAPRRLLKANTRPQYDPQSVVPVSRGEVRPSLCEVLAEPAHSAPVLPVTLGGNKAKTPVPVPDFTPKIDTSAAW